jgi:predicted HD phosphohydrolase
MHLLQSAKLALDGGQDEKVVVACLLHDIANGALLRTDHGYWGAQMIAPYVSEEIAWAVKYHQALRYFARRIGGLQISRCLQPILRA